jgi:DNA invertase Pin-like site-specific DNA recombinase
MKDQLIAYYRVSTDTQIKNDTIENQRVACQEFARKMKADIIEEYVERSGISGSVDDRPEYQKAIVRLTSPDVDGLIVYALDRWSRKKRSSIITMLDLEELHKKVYMASTDEVVDWTREGDDLIMQIKSWLSQKEREKIRARLAQGREKVKAGKGKKHPGKGWNCWKKKDFDRDTWETIDKKLKLGVPKSIIAEDLEISRHTLYRRLKETGRI